jgi:DNA modification methylase
MEIKTIDQIKPYEKNAKLHPKWHIEKIASSIKQFGCKQPIVIDKDGILVAGHGRFEAMTKLLGYTQLEQKGATKKGEAVIPYILADDLDETEIKAYRLADNQINAMTGIDTELAIEELKELDLAGFDISLTGFNTDLIIEPEPKDNEIPNNPIVTQTIIGDLYELGGHRILCGDSKNTEHMSMLMNDNKADMVFTDPPWNVDYGNTPKDNPQGYKPRTILNDALGDDFVPFLSDVFSNASAFSKGGALTYVVMSAQEWGGMMHVMKKNGYHWSSTIIWKKDRLVMSRKDYHTQYEPIWYGWKEGSRLKPLEDRKQSDVWDIPRPSDSPLHPTTKPVALCEKAIINSSKNEDIVLDQFLGSGSTLIACEKTGRKCYGMELDPKYVDVIVERYCEFTGNRKIKKNGQEIEWQYEEETQ